MKKKKEIKGIDVLSAGIFVALLPWMLRFATKDDQEKIPILASLIWDIVLRVVCCLWIIRIAKSQKLRTTTWAIFCLLLPGISLIMISFKNRYVVE